MSYKILFEGVLLDVEDGSLIEKGDTYIAKRNTGWKLLTCKEHNRVSNYVIPIENEYAYDTYECRKVVSVLDN